MATQSRFGWSCVPHATCPTSSQMSLECQQTCPVRSVAVHPWQNLCCCVIVVTEATTCSAWTHLWSGCQQDSGAALGADLQDQQSRMSAWSRRTTDLLGGKDSMQNPQLAPQPETTASARRQLSRSRARPVQMLPDVCRCQQMLAEAESSSQ